jgi:hypothetical protein
MRDQILLETHAGLAEEAIGRLEFRPMRKRLGQGSARMGGQVLRDIHQPLITPLVSQRCKSKRILCPLTSRY